mmetsp:Transcript_43906/g.103863  ORF Transcript_43906/g.103863 Transcript_43906/m.103863 type:complete len:254 (+) Transcript_43906:218-979(+)
MSSQCPTHYSGSWTLGFLLSQLLNLLCKLVCDLVLLVEIDRRANCLRCQITCLHGNTAQSALDADILVKAIHGCGHGADKAIKVLLLLWLQVLVQGLAQSTADFVCDGILAVHVVAEVEALQNTLGDSLQASGDVGVLLLCEVRGGRKQGGANPHTSHKETGNASQNTCGGFHALLVNLHEGNALRWWRRCWGASLSIECHSAWRRRLPVVAASDKVAWEASEQQWKHAQEGQHAQGSSAGPWNSAAHFYCGV